MRPIGQIGRRAIRPAAVLLLMTLVLCAELEGSITSIEPSAPKNNELIRARIEFEVPGGCFIDPVTTVTGSVIRTNIAITNCVNTIPFTTARFVTFGPLPSGTYTYQVYRSYGDAPPILDATTTIVVSDAPPVIPLLDPGALLLLAGLLGVVAVLTLR